MKTMICSANVVDVGGKRYQRVIKNEQYFWKSTGVMQRYILRTSWIWTIYLHNISLRYIWLLISLANFNSITSKCVSVGKWPLILSALSWQLISVYSFISRLLLSRYFIDVRDSSPSFEWVRCEIGCPSIETGVKEIMLLGGNFYCGANI